MPCPLPLLPATSAALYTLFPECFLQGMTGILVLSGEATMEDVAASDVQPDLIFGRLSDMIPYL